MLTQGAIKIFQGLHEKVIALLFLEYSSKLSFGRMTMIPVKASDRPGGFRSILGDESLHDASVLLFLFFRLNIFSNVDLLHQEVVDCLSQVLTHGGLINCSS